MRSGSSVHAEAAAGRFSQVAATLADSPDAGAMRIPSAAFLHRHQGVVYGTPDLSAFPRAAWLAAAGVPCALPNAHQGPSLSGDAVNALRPR